MLRRTLCVAAPLLAVAGLAGAPPSASATGATTGSRVTTGYPTQSIDTRSDAPIGKVTKLELPVGLLTVAAIDPPAPTLIDIRSCGTVSDGDPSRDLMVVLPNRAASRSVVIANDGTCLFSDQPVDVSVFRLGNVAATPSPSGLQFVTVKLAADGSVCLFSKWGTHAVVDVASWFGSGDQGFRAVTPERLLDTRKAIGVPTTTPIEPDGVVVVDVGQSLAERATAVLLNVTVTDPAGSGFVTAYPCDQPRPTASNLNFVAGQTVPNLVSVKVSTGGAVCLYAKSRTHLIADIAGYVTPSTDEYWTNVLSA